MKNALVGLVGLVVLLGVAGRAKADTIDFTFVSAPNSGGTYVDASGTFIGNVTYYNNPADENIFVVNGGTITVVSNVPPTPFDPSIPGPRTPELNGSSDMGHGGSFLFSNTAGGVNVTHGPTGGCCYVSFLMPGSPAYDGDFVLYFIASGINGAPDNSELVASDEGNHDYLYTTDGTLTLYGQVGDYQLTPEPPSWLLLGSGVMLLGFVAYRRTAAV